MSFLDRGRAGGQPGGGLSDAGAESQRGDGGAEGFQPLLGDIGLANMGGPPRGIDAVRLFAGYAGWGAGQLQDEVEEGAWYVVESEPHDAFGDESAQLWAGVLRRQPDDLKLHATRPADPSLN